MAVALSACEYRVQLDDPCNSTDCASGCCQNGRCLPFNEQSASACGASGLDCAPCSGLCTRGVCSPSTCGPCTGCCSDPFCNTGDSDLQCGKAGQLCQRCSSNETCRAGVCTACTPANCAGCCDFFSKCVLGTTNTDCGSGGSSCSFCGPGKSCQAGACK